MMRKIRKILVANRGEIALRIMRTCRDMGLTTVAIYSDIDSSAPFVHYADESYPLKGVKPADSYLHQEKIMEVAKLSGADAIHPGYGFLSENENFARTVEENGVVFVGPPPNVIKRLGDKTTARSLANSLGIPVVPGIMESLTSLRQAKEHCKLFGYPILLKAAGGGGGKGMRIVQSPDELESSLAAAMSEAQTAFKDDRIYIEKYVESPRHIEVQILADKHKNIIHLGERECSIQRRHQKIIEESPSLIVDDTLRQKLTQSAITLMKASSYVNAGTVEFLVDRDKNFYFLEVNTRLQVEHPVTEMRTRLDLVREQLHIAMGEKLSLSQGQVAFDGYALECRIYAEDPYNSFYPSTGRIVHLQRPSGPYVRDDTGIEAGDEVSPFYDPLLSKVTTWGKTRAETLTRMSNALSKYEIYGVRHNVHLCLWIISHPEFKSGNYDTNFITRQFVPDTLMIPGDVGEAASIASAISFEKILRSANANGGALDVSLWKSQNSDFMR